MREDLARAPGARELDAGAAASRAPPVRLLLADAEPNGSSLAAGRHGHPQALVAAADQLAAHRPGLSFR